MDIASLDMDLRRCGIEVLELKFANRAAIHGIGIVRTEAGNVELDHSASYLLVRRESYAYVSVPEFGMADYVLHRIHNLRHSGLVIGAQEGSPVGSDEGLSLIIKKFREFRRPQGQARVALERNVRTVIFTDDLRLHVLAGSIGRSVHVSYESDGRHLAVYVGRYPGHDVAIFIK